MNDPDDPIACFHGEAKAHVHLAVIAEAVPVAAMHIDLARFNEERAHAYAELGEDPPGMIVLCR